MFIKIVLNFVISLLISVNIHAESTAKVVCAYWEIFLHRLLYPALFHSMF